VEVKHRNRLNIPKEVDWKLFVPDGDQRDLYKEEMFQSIILLFSFICKENAIFFQFSFRFVSTTRPTCQWKWQIVMGSLFILIGRTLLDTSSELNYPPLFN
jgi:hypothetical protein